MNKKIFVSYTTRDGFITRAYLLNLEEKLRKNFDVFIDMIHNDSKNPQRRIISELASSDVVMLLKTCDSYKSPWVVFELNLAVNNMKTLLIIDAYNYNIDKGVSNNS